MTRAFDTRRAMEAWARENGWPVDRPWVKAHGGICSCWRCVPHVVHDAPHFAVVRTEYQYPCGLLVAVSNDLQDEQLLAGATHGQSYASAENPITCPGCLEVRARMQTFSRTTQGRNAHAED